MQMDHVRMGTDIKVVWVLVLERAVPHPQKGREVVTKDCVLARGGWY